MNSFFMQMFIDLQDRITSEVEEIKYVEQNLGQYLDEKYRDSVSFPCVLIDFPTTTFSGMSGNIQLGAATINLVLLFEAHSQSYNIAPAASKELALKYYMIEQKLHKALQGWSNEYCTPLDRVSTKSQNRHDKAVRIREIDYSTEFEDWSLEDETRQEFTFAFTGEIQQPAEPDEN